VGTAIADSNDYYVKLLSAAKKQLTFFSLLTLSKMYQLTCYLLLIPQKYNDYLFLICYALLALSEKCKDQMPTKIVKFDYLHFSLIGTKTTIYFTVRAREKQSKLKQGWMFENPLFGGRGK
jgi:hypothetical protein